MYLIELAVKSVQLGEMLTTGQGRSTASGYTVNNSPSLGAILQTSQGAYGHVAYVESVGSDGSVTVSEMNYGHGVGVVTSRTISFSQVAYITTFTNSISSLKAIQKWIAFCVYFQTQRYIH